jgi:hypothetical protein
VNTNKWSFWSIVFALLMLAMSGSGCDGSASAESISPAESEELVYYATGCEDFTVPQGFELHWEWFNHRISYLKMRPSERAECQPVHLEAGFIGGSFSTGAYFEDTPHISYLYQPVSAHTPDEMSASRVTLSANIGPSGVVSGTRELSRDQLALNEYDHVIAIIEGISFHTGVDQNSGYPSKYNPSNGYTMRGIGAKAQISALTPEQIQLEYALRFETGVAPDWRPNMNRAREHALVRGHLDVLLIGMNDTPVHQKEVAYDMAYPVPSFGNKRQEPPNGDKVHYTVAGNSGGPSGFVGLTRWNFDMEFPITCDEDSDCPGGETCVLDQNRCTKEQGPLGDYLKTLQVSVRQADYDPDTGDAEFEVIGYASNTSTGIVFAPLEYEFSAEFVWAQANGASKPRQIVRNRFNTGETSIELDRGPFETKGKQASAEPASADDESKTVAD